MEFAFNTHDIISSILTGLILVIAWFLRQKDAAQQREIKEIKEGHKKAIDEIVAQHKADINKLWEQHHVDADALKDFKLEVSQKHYPADEIDKKFEKIESTLSKGFEQVMDHLSRLNTILLGRAIGKDSKNAD